MDPLSEVLKSLRFEGAVFLDTEFTAPWCVRTRFGLSDAKPRLDSSHHVIFFHWLTSGYCKVRLVDDARSFAAKAGDLLLFPQDDQHLVGSDLQLSPVDSRGEMVADGNGIHYSAFGGGGEATRIVCGYITCNRETMRPLLDALPSMLIVPLGLSSDAPLLHQILSAAVGKSGLHQPGIASTMSKLAELLFVEAIRCHVESQRAGARGWLAGVKDAHIGRALAALHAEPHRDWTVDELAHRVAISRSSLAERFSVLVGESPIQYLTRLRLAVAAQRLRSGADPIGKIAQQSGYESDAAFSRAFKREFGVSPSSWRHGRIQGGGSGLRD